ncbi:MAG: L,D-transpeptidase family protein [Alphaproteobacteria bacterium]|nr:L,D-transpeptidase family protein [Alphaproteobacteria bacterium]
MCASAAAAVAQAQGTGDKPVSVHESLAGNVPVAIDEDALETAAATPADASQKPATPRTIDPPPLEPSAVDPAATPQAAREPDPVVAALLTKLAETAELRDAMDKDDVNAIATYYASVTDRTVWTTRDGFTPAAKDALAEIANADDWGLRASDFELPTLVGRSFADAALAEAELKVAIAVLKYARFARGGRFDPSSISRLFDQSPEIAEPLNVLRSLSRSRDVAADLRGYHPKHPQFERLRQALLDLRRAEQAAATKAGETAKVDGKAAAEGKPGEKADDKDAMTARSEGKSKPAATALQLIVNMERWRWVQRDLGDFYVWDDVPAQMTRVIDNGKVVFEEKIVVGKPDTPTPIFSSPMLYVIFQPSWGVPPGMKANELAPQLRNTGGGWFSSKPLASSVLKAHGLRVTRNGTPVDPDSVDWSSANISNYHFTQPPGAANVLGVVKFRFPNKHNVYMHDTPERNLFGKQDRAFSHGCMRVENPVRLAEVLLQQDKGWDSERVADARRRGENIELTTPIPVHVAYFTVAVDDGGRIDVHRDSYGLDNRLASRLEGRNVRVGGAAVATSKRQTSPRKSYANKRKKRRATEKNKPFNPFASLVD